MNELERIPSGNKKISQYILGNARTLMIVFILFIVVVVMTTDIRLVTVSSITDLGLEFFLILFSSYGMFICCADGGTKRGYSTDVYKNSVDHFEEHKKKIEDNMLPRMNEFCNYYVDEELRISRMQYLSVACIPYDVYMEKYVKLDKTDIEALTELTSTQKKAVIKANKIDRIKLTPEMILTRGRTVHTRSGLTTNPRVLKNISFSIKMVKMSFISICMSLIALDLILEPSWTVFAEVCLKLVTVVINGFDGDKEGFNIIAVHTVNYMDSQTSLMHQALLYGETHPQSN
jgi:hypothetical protein